MAIALDVVTSKALTNNSTTWTHTPVGTPRGVIVFCHEDEDLTDVITAVTYGGVAMSRLQFAAAAGDSLNSGEYAYFLGSGIPAGAQTVAVTHSAAKNMTYESITFTAATGETQVVDSEKFSGSGAAPRGTDLSLGGLTCWVGMGLSSEHYALTQWTPLAGWTATRETDHGNSTTAYIVYNTIGTVDVVWGVDVGSLTTLDFAMVAVAVSELAVTFIPQIIMS